jgi:hypothetical protein
MQLPTDYLTYLRRGSPTFGDVTFDDFDRYFELWLESDIEPFNTEYEVPKLAPGFLAFATNAGGELYAFNEIGQVFELPCIGMDARYATLLAESWREFEDRIQNAGEQASASDGDKRSI